MLARCPPPTAPASSGTGALIGYARVSTVDRNPQLQLNAPEFAGCAKLFVDHASGAKTDRPELAAAPEYARAGDKLCIWKLDLLGRSLPHLIEIAGQLADREKSRVPSLTGQIDTASAGGQLILHLFGTLAEFERDLIRERTTPASPPAPARAGARGLWRPRRSGPPRPSRPPRPSWPPSRRTDATATLSTTSPRPSASAAPRSSVIARERGRPPEGNPGPWTNAAQGQNPRSRLPR